MEKYNCDFLVIIHRIFYEQKTKKGGVDIIMDFLLEQGRTIFLLEHSLEHNDNSFFKKVKRDGAETLKNFAIRPARPPWRWLVEIFYSVVCVLKNFNSITCCIAVDPLNFLSAIILKKLKRVKKIYFHCIDYSENRFSNKYLNKIYISLYRFSLRRADVSGVVSIRMLDKFISYGIRKGDLYFIPNSPLFRNIDLDTGEKNKYSLVIMSGEVDDACDFERIFKVMARLKPYFPKMEFKVIGHIEDKEYYQRLKEFIKGSNLDSQVSFLGFFSNQADLAKALGCSGIGITSYVYSRRGHYGIYGDSLKIREYALYGLPIVADNMYSTAFEAEENRCGFVVNNEDEMYHAIKRLWSEPGLYDEYTKNAIEWAKKNDKRKILEDLIKRIYPYDN